MKNISTQILELQRQWDRTNREIITENVEKILTEQGYKTQTERIDILQEITNSSRHTVYAWFNKSREDVKIPFLKLCEIADKFNVEIQNFMQ